MVGESYAQVSIFNVGRGGPKKARTLQHVFDKADIQCDFVACAFSADGKMLACQTGAPEWSLVVWELPKGKKVAGSGASEPLSACKPVEAM